jgi:hypothetical protein
VPPKKVRKNIVDIKIKGYTNMLWQEPKEKKMISKRNWMGMLVVMLAMGIVLAGCPNDTTTPDEFKLEELLREYMGSEPQTWGDGDDAEEVEVYFLEYNRFDDFKAEMDAGGEYDQDGEVDDFTRDWDKGKSFARLGKKPNDRVQLTLAKADNSTSNYNYNYNYNYTKNSQGSGVKLDELLREYMGPNPQIWGEGDDAENVDVYILDYSRFSDFKAEMDAGGKYVEYEDHSGNRDENDGARGKNTAILAVRLNGKKLELRRGNADDTTVEYRYIKIPE